MQAVAAGGGGTLQQGLQHHGSMQQLQHHTAGMNHAIISSTSATAQVNASK